MSHYVLCLGTFWLADLIGHSELSCQLQRHDGSDQKKDIFTVCASWATRQKQMGCHVWFWFRWWLVNLHLCWGGGGEWDREACLFVRSYRGTKCPPWTGPCGGGETGRKVWKRVLLPQLKSELMRYERWSWFMEAKKKLGWLSKLASNSERGFYRPSPYLGDLSN